MASVSPQLAFDLNTSESKAIKCVSFNVVFSRSAILAHDVLFDHHEHSQIHDATNATEYSADIDFALKDIYDQVLESLQLSKVRMQQEHVFPSTITSRERRCG